MLVNTKKLLEGGCNAEKNNKICRSRGGESCAFDGAVIVLQPIADTAHIVHGPIACAGNSWEGRGSLSSRGNLHKMGFTTDMGETDIIYGSEDKLYNAIIQTYESVKPKAIFVYSTCVSGLIGEDIEAVCKKAEEDLSLRGKAQRAAVPSKARELDVAISKGSEIASPSARNDRSKIRVIPVDSPGFAGPKNLGNRIAGKVLLEHVIGTGEPDYTTPYDINLIGEYNIAGDLWLIEPLLKDAGIRILSRITGDTTFEEITYAHRAKLNVVVCSRALINIATEMERKYGIPYIEVSFFGKTETAKALRMIANSIPSPLRGEGQGGGGHVRPDLTHRVESIIQKEESKLEGRLKNYAHLKGKRAVLYTGGVKSWSLISALRDLGIEIVAVGTKKSTFEDEVKMRELMGENAPLVEDVAAKNLLALMKEGKADMLIAGGRNQYLAMKEGYPFVDVNQERHIAYAGYEGLVNMAEQISNSIKFFDRQATKIVPSPRSPIPSQKSRDSVTVNPLKHSPALGAAIAFQGIHNALPIIHGAQGCGFLGKVLLTKHFREPIALASTKLFTEDVVMGSDETLTKIIQGFMDKNHPDIIGILSSGLSEVKGDDINGTIKTIAAQASKPTALIYIPTPDYNGGLETGFARAVEGLISLAEGSLCLIDDDMALKSQVNVLVGSHLTPADVAELRDIIESFNLRPIILPDLSALDGSRQGFSALAVGGTRVDDIGAMRLSSFTIVIGSSMEPTAEILKEKYGVEYRVFKSISGLRDTDSFMELLSKLSRQPIPSKYERQRRVLIDGMRDDHFYLSGKKVCLALEPDQSIQISRLLYEAGVDIDLAVIPTPSISADKILTKDLLLGDLFSIDGKFDLLISNSHGEDAARRLGVPLYQIGFPVYKVLGNNSRVSIGYKGTLSTINEVANILV